MAAAAIGAAHRARGAADPTGEAAVRAVVAGIARQHAAHPAAAPRQAAPLSLESAVLLMTLAQQRRRSGRGVESAAAAAARALADGAIVSLAFCAGLRRSEIAALRWRDVSATERAGLSRDTRKPVDTCADYLLKYAPYLHYDRYLAAGYPIATGVIEGACRHLVRDRMELSGARWRLVGAEAVLKLRALRASGDFDAYWDFHEAREHERNHAQRYADGIAPPVTEPPLPPSSPPPHPAFDVSSSLPGCSHKPIDLSRPPTEKSRTPARSTRRYLPT